jgi:uncharacterized protein
MSAGAGDAQTRAGLRVDRFGNAYPETATSFDCSKASINVERMICSDSGLALSDGSLADLYALLMRRMTLSQRVALRGSQRSWLARRNTCENRACIASAYDTRFLTLVEALEARERRLRSRVSRVGQCQLTRIDFIGPRLQQVQGQQPSGTTVQFENGVHQVSYDREPAALMSVPGDAVRVCLASMPAHCPPGDDRGRVYEVTNLRTNLHWRLSDSSHGCGGA